jgi:hypothetical protein
MLPCRVPFCPGDVPPERALIAGLINAVSGGLFFINVCIDDRRWSFEGLAHSVTSVEEAEGLSDTRLSLTLYAKFMHDLLYHVVHWIEHGVFNAEACASSRIFGRTSAPLPRRRSRRRCSPPPPISSRTTPQSATTRHGRSSRQSSYPSTLKIRSSSAPRAIRACRATSASCKS